MKNLNKYDSAFLTDCLINEKDIQAQAQKVSNGI